jgi:xanthosine utilization system XapX-like protein
MSRKFGPTRGELQFRAVVSVFGLGLMGVALWVRGIPSGPGLIEVVGLAGLMFGGSLVHAVWKLLKRDHP